MRERTPGPSFCQPPSGFSAQHHAPMVMPKKEKTCVFYPRRKEGEDPDGPTTRHVKVSYQDLEALFHLPLKDAAREMGLCPSTFKKACRRFDMDQWPFLHGRLGGAITPPAAPTLQTTELEQAKHAVTVSCTSPFWHDRSSAKIDSSSFGFHLSSAASSSSNDRASSKLHSDSLNPVGAFSSSAAPPGLLQHAPMALDTRSYGEARHGGPAFPFSSSAAPSTTLDTRSYGETRHAQLAFPAFSSAAPQGLLQQASMALDTRSFSGVPLPLPQSSVCRASGVRLAHGPAAVGLGADGIGPEGLPTTRPCGGEQGGATPLETEGAWAQRGREDMGTAWKGTLSRTAAETGPPQERPCVEAVLDYLEGPLAGDFDFMFADEEGRPPQASLRAGGLSSPPHVPTGVPRS